MAKAPALLGARTGLISGSCKRETGEQHAQILETTLDAARVTNLRTICICSDGEARRGKAMIHLTFKNRLSPSSAIYDLLCDLEFMNFMVGDDDLTADKDYKHVFKCLRNWLLRLRGIVVLDLEISMAALRSQLHHGGLNQTHTNNLLHPNDRQNVNLAYTLLREIWRLPQLDGSSGKAP